MALLKLESVDAFVVRDLDEEVPAFGIVRAANKILQGGAKELARSQTYQCALFNMKCQGASAGINAAPESRDDAIAAFAQELLPLVSNGALLLDPGKGIRESALDPLTAIDPRNEAHRRQVNGLSNQHHLTGFGAVVSAQAARNLDGASIAIENYELAGPAVASAAAERGARVTAIATSAGAAFNADGFDAAALHDALKAKGPAMVADFTDEELPGWRVLGADVDVLFAGSKMGLINHQGATNVKAKVVSPTGPIPYTTKGALVLEQQGTTVLPDIVTTAGAMFGGMPPGEDDQVSIERAISELLSTLTGQIVGQKNMPILEACHRAEAFLATWRDELPFGRPFAS